LAVAHPVAAQPAVVTATTVLQTAVARVRHVVRVSKAVVTHRASKVATKPPVSKDVVMHRALKATVSSVKPLAPKTALTTGATAVPQAVVLATSRQHVPVSVPSQPVPPALAVPIPVVVTASATVAIPSAPPCAAVSLLPVGLKAVHQPVQWHAAAHADWACDRAYGPI
jgi:hypothetical protein